MLYKNTPQHLNVNSHTTQTVALLVIEQKTQIARTPNILIPGSHSADVTLRGGKSLVATPQNQHGEIYQINSQIQLEIKMQNYSFFSIITIYQTRQILCTMTLGL